MDVDHIIPWYYKKFFQYIVQTVLILVGILLIHKAFFLFRPIIDFISTIIPPIIISLLIYYLLRPIVNGLEHFRIPRIVSIIALYIMGTLFLSVFLTQVIPLLTEQFSSIANVSASALEKMQQGSNVISIGPFTIDWEFEIQQRLMGFLKDITVSLSHNLVDFIAIVTRITTILIVIPFIVFYLLKEDHDFSSRFLESMPEDFTLEVKKILKNIDQTLSRYITGLVMVSLSIGLMLFIVYMIIGLNYALLLAFLAIIFMSIPFLGPFLAITPAILIGFSQDPWMAVKVIVGFVIVQQIESNIISPQIIGQRLHIHPLTIILILLAAGTLYGLVGLILATPAYALAKVILGNLYKIYLLKYPKIKANLAKT